MPRAPATPPPPPQRLTDAPLPRSFTPAPAPSATSLLEQRLGATQLELRKLGSERHTLRSRLRREADRVRELESALRAEKELRAQAADEHFAALAGVRARLADMEAEKAREVASLGGQLAHVEAELTDARAALSQALEHARLSQSAAGAERAPKAAQGLKRIRGIGPGYERALSALGVTRVEQVASWGDAEIEAFAAKLKVRPERIRRDDWVGQARALPTE